MVGTASRTVPTLSQAGSELDSLLPCPLLVLLRGGDALSVLQVRRPRLGAE